MTCSGDLECPEKFVCFYGNCICDLMHGPECQVANPVATGWWISMLFISVCVFLYSCFVLKSEKKKSNIGRNKTQLGNGLKCCSITFSNRNLNTCRYITIAMAGTVSLASVNCYRCSNLPYKDIVKDYLYFPSIVFSSVPSYAAMLSISLKWIEVSRTELHLITRENMVKSSNCVTFVKFLFVATYVLSATVAHNYAHVLGILFVALVALFFLVGSTMVHTKLQVVQKKDKAKPANICEPNPLNGTNVQKLETKADSNVGKQSNKLMKTVRATFFHPKVHAGISIQTKRESHSSGTKLPASEGALAILRTARIISGICCGNTICFVTIFFYKSPRFYFLAELCLAVSLFLQTLGNLCMLRYIRGGSKSSYLIKKLYSNISQGEMVRKFNAERRRRRKRRGYG